MQKGSVLLLLSIVWMLLVGCVGSIVPTGGQSVGTGLSSFTAPRWVCPSPTPLPTRIKTESEPTATGTPTDPAPIYYETWEQEYGLPLMTPTPSIKTGTTFFQGQIVEVAEGVYAQPSVQATAGISDTLYWVTVTWTNQATQTIRLNPARQIVMSTIKRPDGRLIGGTWQWTRAAALAAGLPSDESSLQITLPAGESTIVVPIFAPAAVAAVVDIRMDAPGAQDATSAGTFRVQFALGNDPTCDFPGVIGATIGPGEGAIGVPPPPGASGIVASALRQVGRQYCWGGKGSTRCDGYGGGTRQVTPACASYPCFDCSGLTWWAYADNGVTIGHGTSNQQNYPVVSPSAAGQGDLALFGGMNTQGRSGITHVGLVADVNADGKMDLIHAANYPDGVIISYDFLRSSWYAPRLVIITRPPRGSGI